ncbi:Alpha/Beta hydrolase protein [Mycena maculata]|uniref:Alpha/Beta hydrolase protein n=1 Tax=Mycena maculata TaxID=230809 RepID=A0AAD7H753_9AGAR|nr:Alpha/Beta hydrolase protein [Mycena maculata]
MSQYAHLSDPDPEFAHAFSKLPVLPPPVDPLQAGRSFMAAMASKSKENNRPMLPHHSSYSIEDCNIAVDGGEITVRCTKPTPTSAELPEFPVLFWLHGGGWVAGDVELDDFPHRIISVKYRISIVNVAYRLAPEHRFPIGLNDCYSALKWTVENTTRLSANTAKGFLVGGASSGGNLATVLAHRARDDPFFHNHKITGQILQFPPVLHRAAYPVQYKDQLLSIEQNRDGPNLTAAALDFFADALQVSPSDPDFSPLLAPHEGLAPAYIQVCGLDPLRDEGLLYERLLREVGVKTKLDIYPGVPHAFSIGFPHLAASIKFQADFHAGLTWLLDAKV